ncbi:hypothetical protein TEA_009442 [Camellia sinensis var. sinensis]|uniref:non-specific serine/threonine protein kinase n=1 Tax=Camellia sinensis var. sinensis TaxID=542762 RepID=A0A4S4DJC3_CAMSN|nr:hypothetical protein TEA_009442 [Camellia sinensis var. sinensis]
MSSVVLMLGNEGALPQAKQPGFFTERNVLEVAGSSRKEATTSANEMTIILGDIKLEFDDSHASYIEEIYSRVLDLDTATMEVKYSAGEVEFVKEHFASNPDQVIVTKISGSKSGSLSFMVSLDSKLHHHSSVNGKNQIIMEGSCPGKRILPKLNENDNPKGIQFSAILDLQISDVGTINVLDDNKLKNEGSDWAVMLLLSKSSKNVGEIGCLDRKKHLSSATDLFLENSEDKVVSTAERVKSFQTDEDPSLVELLFQYGRYLLISCSRPGTQVANLQGIWNKDIEPAWECQIYGQKHLLTEVRLFRLYGKWAKHGFVLIYGSIILIPAGLLLQCCCEAAATRRCSISSVFFACTSTLVDIITKTQSVTGNNTSVSSGGSFEMGFFSPGNSRNIYLGIWYKKISVQTVVWVANREIPLVNSSGVLTTIDPGILALVDGTSSVIWSPNVTGPVAQLMESGNLVVKDANNNILWQSFDYPCDTLLPGMKQGKNFVTGIDRMLSSWKSSDDPARGKCTYRCDPQGYPQIIMNCGSVEVFRTGPWNGLGFSYLNLKLNSVYTYELVYTKEEVDVLELKEAVKIKDGESEAYISEIETNGQAYEDMQTQNQHLLQQVAERDDYNIKYRTLHYTGVALECGGCGEWGVVVMGGRFWDGRGDVLGCTSEKLSVSLSFITQSNYIVHSGQFEVGVLDWFTRLWELEKNKYWGYITNCGTEGKLHGILVGREVFPDGILYGSRESHYSVFKPARMYRMECEKVDTLVSGEIDCKDFKTKLLCHEQASNYQRKHWDVLELKEAVKIKDGESEAYISEIETISQAYEDMQTQNQHLLQQVAERDDYNIKIGIYLVSMIYAAFLGHNGVRLLPSFQEWVIYRSAPTDACDTYKLCGPNGNCNIGNSPVCDCLSKFVPQNQTEWISGDWSNGCVRRTMLDCHNGDGFLKYSHYKMPDTRYSWFDKSMTLGECEMRCLKNCSCMAYTSLDISEGGSGCLLWFDELIDMRQYSDKGQDIYIRMASSELVQQVGFNGKKREIVAVSLALLIGLLLLGVSLTCYLWKKKRKNSQLNREGNLMQNSKQGYTDKSQNDDLELPLFDLTVIANSTNNFSINNKLGEGGFGPVYKGMLEGGQETAVKRLSKNSSQGLDEFKNEVICIAKLQHRNLVKLLGCCIQGEEKMLIYEYMPNKSLDYFIFDQTQSGLLDWPKRFHIINGIARGLLYLHQDSRLRIIHRDLKASNILLDVDMNPKISDFGMARSFRGNETEANTNKVVGTYGYMSPEYAVDGLFSIKSDVFSFGVLVLEIVSGKKNKGFYHPDHHLNLLGHAWRLYKDGRSLELIDEAIWDSCYLTEVLRSIHVGLLCVQQYPEDRPSMSSVVLMLGNEGALPQAKQPGFFTERNVLEAAGSSANEVTISLLNAR